VFFNTTTPCLGKHSPAGARSAPRSTNAAAALAPHAATQLLRCQSGARATVEASPTLQPPLQPRAAGAARATLLQTQGERGGGPQGQQQRCRRPRGCPTPQRARSWWGGRRRRLLPGCA